MAKPGRPRSTKAMLHRAWLRKQSYQRQYKRRSRRRIIESYHYSPADRARAYRYFSARYGSLVVDRATQRPGGLPGLIAAWKAEVAMRKRGIARKAVMTAKAAAYYEKVHGLEFVAEKQNLSRLMHEISHPPRRRAWYYAVTQYRDGKRTGWYAIESSEHGVIMRTRDRGKAQRSAAQRNYWELVERVSRKLEIPIADTRRAMAMVREYAAKEVRRMKVSKAYAALTKAERRKVDRRLALGKYMAVADWLRLHEYQDSI